MGDKFTVVWFIQTGRYNSNLLPHYTDITIHHGPINKDTVTKALLKEVNKDGYFSPLEERDISILSWNRLE